MRETKRRPQRRQSASGTTRRSARPLKISDLIYALHTVSCSYLLDEAGICRRIASVNGVIPKHIRQCIGAQFVACLDLHTPGGLIGELRAGTMALFVKHDGDHMSLLRTSRISTVDDWRRPKVGTVISSAPTEPLAAEPIPMVVPKPQLPPGVVVPPNDTVPPIPRPVPVPRMPESTRQRQPHLTYRAKLPPQLSKVRYEGEEASVTIVRPFQGE